MATADDRRLLELAAEPAGELFPMLQRAPAFRPLLVLFAVLPGLYALTQRTLSDTSAWWSLASLEVAAAESPDLLPTEAESGAADASGAWRPPLSVWLTAVVMRGFGPDQGISTVLASYLATIALIVLAYHLFGRLGDARLGLWTAVFMAFHGPVLSQAQTPVPISLGVVLSLATIWGFYVHIRAANGAVSVPLLLAGVAWALCLLAAGPIALGVLLVLVACAVAVPPRRPAARVVPHPAAARRKATWSPAVPLAVLTLTAFVAGAWWPLLTLWNTGWPDLGAWLSFGRLEGSADVAAGSVGFWLGLLEDVRETLGAIGGFVLLGLWRAVRVAWASGVDPRKPVAGTSLGWLRLLVLWTGVGLVALAGVIWLVPGSWQAVAAWQGFLVVPVIGLAAYAADEIARRRIGLLRALSAAVMSLMLMVDVSGWRQLFAEASDPGLLALTLLVGGPLFVLIVWRICRESDDRQQVVLTLVIVAHVAANAALGLTVIHRQTEDDRALLAFRRELSAVEQNLDKDVTVTRWALISDVHPPLPLRYILRSEWPHASPRPVERGGVVETWDAAVAVALNESTTPEEWYVVVEWSSRDSQPTNIPVPGIQIVPLGRPQFYLDRQLRAFQVAHEEGRPQAGP